MRISHGQVDNLLKAYSQQATQARAGATQAPSTQTLGADKVTLSDRAREIQMVQDVVSRTPDVRQDRIDAVVKAIADGKYSVKGEDIAERLLARVVADKLGE